MNSKKPLISVIMSVYNGENYLNEAIESILNQTYANLEFIIINDGSTDKSLDIINSYTDKRIILINQQNKGLTKSLNIGIEQSNGEYIARQDADDISLPTRFDDFINFLNASSNKIDLYSTPASVVDDKGTKIKDIPNYFKRNAFNSKFLNFSNCLIHGSLIVDSSLLKRFKYNEKYRYAQDFELYHRLLHEGLSISYNNTINYKLRVHGDSLSKQKQEEQFSLFKSVLDTRGLRFFKPNILNRIYFLMNDINSYIKAKVKY